ncbi:MULTISPECIES: pyridoxamine 5'-phosphate oxidase family protein [unclassified Sphingomonas]|uniref:pyridoxamine 5'-phosphate oxidase family protein n=1 Tax=unclassified Sphingomonas TaxID=196159 RepID=UPI000BCF94E9|nr:MAG: pyridoxamine 5'-phosphate oxidase [Sphingomonas sp. 12-62-6]OYX38790.1 MAG: pyridoxamine 5'-phosphate oxidase [Sphingomonas sp. 32-62-10]
MDKAIETPSDIFFSPAVKAVQSARGSRENYARAAARGAFRTEINDDLISRLAEADSFYLATASADGQPYIQHRGGPPGFIRVLDKHRIAFADYRGNKQYISTGNLSENDRAQIFIMDYVNQRRVKIWGRAETTQDPQIIAQLMPEGYRAQGEQAIVFTIDVWDLNCPQHIPIKLPLADVAPIVTELRARVADLEAELARLR